MLMVKYIIQFFDYASSSYTVNSDTYKLFSFGKAMQSKFYVSGPTNCLKLTR